MTYAKTTWVNNTSPAINATNLNKMETGIDEIHTVFDTGILIDALWNSVHPFLDENYSNDKGIPTMVERGLFRGYSMDIWETPAKPYEELLFKMRIPHNWDGVTCPWFVAITATTGAEDIGDKYKFQMEWQSEDILHIMPDTIQETVTSEVTLTTTDAWYANIISFECDATTMVAGQNIQWRLRRVAASSNEVTNEPVIFHWDTRWKTNKIGTVSVQGY